MKKYPAYVYVEFPKALYLNGVIGDDSLTVINAEEEAAAAERGYYPHGSAAAHIPEPDALRVEAERLGIKVDKRWGASRIAAEIEKAQK